MKKCYVLFILFYVALSTFYAQTKPQIHVQQGHSSGVICVAFSPDGKTVISGSGETGLHYLGGGTDKTIRLWDVQSGKELRVFAGHLEQIYAVAFLPDGKTFLSAFLDKTIKMWDVASGKLLKTYKNNEAVLCIAVSPDGKLFASGESSDTPIKIWDIESGKIIQRYSKHPNIITSLTFSRDGKAIFYGGLFGLAELWDIEQGATITKFQGHKSKITAVAVSPDGMMAVTGSDEKESDIKLWDIKSGTEIRTFTHDISNSDKYIGHLGDINSLVFTPDGKSVISAAYDKTLKIWEVSTGKQIKSIDAHLEQVTSLAISPNGKTFVSGSDDRTLKLWETENGMLINEFSSKSEKIVDVRFSPDGKTLIGIGGSNLYLWDIMNAKLSNTYNNVISLLPDGQTAISTPMYNSFKLFNINNNQEIKSISGNPFFLNKYTASPDGKMIILGDATFAFKLLNISTGSEINFGTKENPSGNVTFSPDQKTIITSSWGVPILWDATTGNAIKQFDRKIYKGLYLDSDINSMVISPDGKYVITGGGHLKTEKDTDELEKRLYGQTTDQDYIEILKFPVNLWDISTGKIVKSLFGHTDEINSVTASPDGKYIASGSNDYTIKLWDFETGKEIRTFKGHNGNVYSVSFSPDGSTICSGSEDNTIKYWEVETGKLIFSAVCSKDGSNWLVYNDEGYWDGSPNGSELVVMVQGMDVYAIDQFATKNNRPDKILGNIAGSSADLILHYSKQYQKRLRKRGITEEQLSADNHVPIAKIVEAKQNSKFIDLKFSLSDNKYLLKSYNIYLNDVPLFGYYGKKITGNKVELAEKVELVFGDNKIEISCTNEKDAESYRAAIKKTVYKEFRLSQFEGLEDVLDEDIPLGNIKGLIKDDILVGIDGVNFNNVKEIKDYINDRDSVVLDIKRKTGIVEIHCDGYRLDYVSINEIKGDLYYLAFGVSKYKNSSYNLLFADKDALDLEKVVLNFKGEGFENVYTKVLTNEQVTPASIKAAKDFLKAAKPDDTFILFIAGHGMHDTDPEATYYFLTSNADLKNLKGTAADFETIEDLLQGIPPRNKLFLMDACESGEIDDETYENLSGFKNLTGLGIASRGFKTVAGEKGQVISGKRTYLYQKDRYIYNDLVRRSGAIVFSSSKGGELSYERSDIENGLFTEYIMKALTTSEADKDNNGIVSTDELRQYVSEQVAKASGDLQHPTVDRDNIYQKFGFMMK